MAASTEAIKILTLISQDHTKIKDHFSTLFELFSTPENSTDLLQHGGLDSLLTMMRAWKSHPLFTYQAVGCVWNFATLPGNAKILGADEKEKLSAVSLLRSIIEEHDDLALHKRAMTALFNITNGCTSICCSTQSTLIWTALYCAEKFPVELSIMELTFGTLAKLCERAGPQAGEVIKRQGGLVVSLAALEHVLGLRKDTTVEEGKVTPLQGVLLNILHCVFQLSTCNVLAEPDITARVACLLVSCMRVYEDWPRVILVASMVINALAGVDSNKSILGEANCVDALVTALQNTQKRASEGTIQTKISGQLARALHCLTRYHDGNVTRLVNANGIPVLKEMCQATDEPAVLDAISVVLLRLSTKYSSLLVSEGCLPAVISLLTRCMKSPVIVSNCCGLLWNFSMGDNKGVICSLGGVTEVLNAIKEYPTHVDIQHRACTTLWNILEAVEVPYIEVLCTTDAPSLLLKVTSDFVDQVEILGLAWGCLLLLLLRCSDDMTYQIRERLLSEGALDSLVKALHMHSDSLKFCEKGMELMLRFSIDTASDTCNSGGLEVLLHCMRKHEVSERIIMSACGALWNLAIHEECRRILAEKPTIQYLIDAMHVHPNSLVIQYRAVTTLFKLSSVTQEEIIDNGGITVMIRALQRHHENGKSITMISNVLGALWNIAMSNDAHKLVIIQHLGIILRCISLYTFNDEIVQRGLTLLFHLLAYSRCCTTFFSKAICESRLTGLRTLCHTMLRVAGPKEKSEIIHVGFTVLFQLTKEEGPRTILLNAFLQSTEKPNFKELQNLQIQGIIAEVNNTHTRRAAATIPHTACISQEACRQQSNANNRDQDSTPTCNSPTSNTTNTTTELIEGNTTTMIPNRSNFQEHIAHTHNTATTTTTTTTTQQESGGGDDNIYFSLLRQVIVAYHRHTRVSIRVAPLLLMLAQHDTTNIMASWLTYPISKAGSCCCPPNNSNNDNDDSTVNYDDTLLCYLVQWIQNTTALDTVKCSIMDVFTIVLSKLEPHSKQYNVIVNASKLYSSLTVILLSTADHARSKAKALLRLVAPHSYDILSRVDLNTLLVDAQRTYIYHHKNTSTTTAYTTGSPSPTTSTPEKNSGPTSPETPTTFGRSTPTRESSIDTVTRSQSRETPCCSICLEEYEEGHELIELSCTHNFHKECMGNWLKDSCWCPCCRAPITSVLDDPVILNKMRESINHKAQQVAALQKCNSSSGGSPQKQCPSCIALQAISTDDTKLEDSTHQQLCAHQREDITLASDKMGGESTTDEPQPTTQTVAQSKCGVEKQGGPRSGETLQTELGELMSGAGAAETPSHVE